MNFVQILNYSYISKSVSQWTGKLSTSSLSFILSLTNLISFNEMDMVENRYLNSVSVFIAHFKTSIDCKWNEIVDLNTSSLSFDSSSFLVRFFFTILCCCCPRIVFIRLRFENAWCSLSQTIKVP